MSRWWQALVARLLRPIIVTVVAEELRRDGPLTDALNVQRRRAGRLRDRSRIRD